MNTSSLQLNQKELFSHPIGLFVLFFTEMWERFSYYGMRALLILFLVSKTSEGGLGWSRPEAMVLFGWYVMLVYFLPIVGGWLADHRWGAVKTTIVGASVITIGHAMLAVSEIAGLELHSFFFYMGLLLVAVGSGLFKPNMTTIISQMYEKNTEKKDGAYTIFYMGVNAGSFIGIMLVGWIGENFSWSLGFGLAGIFMLFGLLQFYFARHIFGKKATKPSFKSHELSTSEKEKLVPFKQIDQTLVGIGSLLALTWIVDGLYAVVSRGTHFLPQSFLELNTIGLDLTMSLSSLLLTVAILIFSILGIQRLTRYEKVERDRLIVVFIFSFFVVFFWACFEQAGTSMTIFAKDYTSRTLDGSYGLIYKVIDFLLTISPMVILTWVIYQFATKLIRSYPATVLLTVLSFLVIWGLIVWRVHDKLNADLAVVDTSWFQILNPFFIVILAPAFAALWKKTNFIAAQKFSLGLALLAFGFALLAFGASSIPKGATVASVSMIWLILAFLFHTLGELAISPVSLSYISKMAPKRMISFIFGLTFLFIGLSGKFAAALAENMDSIAAQNGISGFFLLLTLIPLVAAVLILLLNRKINQLMHGIK